MKVLRRSKKTPETRGCNGDGVKRAESNEEEHREEERLSIEGEKTLIAHLGKGQIWNRRCCDKKKKKPMDERRSDERRREKGGATL
ncbi:hypothetical protein L6452_42526 [Arctium lappa]|uniref:Uncharacterized protein n=1 Tax=Arctium lappa TaxID=4217 RepID=A0ACB8XHW3_ARCLA|nr:hypothetical protein L6452_42526 [Arctium lappa]